MLQSFLYSQVWRHTGDLDWFRHGSLIKCVAANHARKAHDPRILCVTWIPMCTPMTRSLSVSQSRVYIHDLLKMFVTGCHVSIPLTYSLSVSWTITCVNPWLTREVCHRQSLWHARTRPWLARSMCPCVYTLAKCVTGNYECTPITHLLCVTGSRVYTPMTH